MALAARIVTALERLKPALVVRARLLGEEALRFTVAAAKPGFINIKLADEVWHAQLRAILRAGTSFGDSSIGGGQRVNVEFVSANPTGPMHVAHGRGAVVGDALAGLLSKAGFRVSREYYIDDAGAQVDILARSTQLRYREALGEAIESIPAGFYPGDYLIETGRALAERDGRKWLDRPEAEWLSPIREFAVAQMMALIRADLALLGIHHDLFVSERELVEQGAVAECLTELEQRGLIYIGKLEAPKGKLPDDWEPRAQTLFRATKFGDDVDRPLKKSDGSWTYFAADIAYHRDKYRRGFRGMVRCLGRRPRRLCQTNAGRGAGSDRWRCLTRRQALSACSSVRQRLARANVKARRDLRTLREVIDEVGKDVFRFIMLTRRNDQALEFDFAKVTEQSKDNPVFYVQYPMPGPPR